MIPDAKGLLTLPERGPVAERFAWEVEHFDDVALLQLLVDRYWFSWGRHYRVGPNQIAAIKLELLRRVRNAGGELTINDVRYSTEDGKTLKAAMTPR